MTSTSAGCKGQSAFEFIFIFGIFLSALILGTWVSTLKIGEINSYQRSTQVDDLLRTVSEKINTVWMQGDGFSSNVTIPDRVAGSQYEINVTSNFVIVTMGDDHFIRPIITQNVTGKLLKGQVNTMENMGSYINITNI